MSGENPITVNYRSLCVRKQKNEFRYPKTIPKEREKNTAIFISIFCCFLIFALQIFFDSSSFQTILMRYMFGITFYIIIEMIQRTILMCEEYRHLLSRYDGSIFILLKDTFQFHYYIWIIFFICIFCINFLCTSYCEILSLKCSVEWISISLIGKILKLSDSPLNNSLWVAESNGLDYGSGMAYSFFHGYLNLVLTKTGTEEKNLSEMIEDYEDKNKVTFGAHKLFILIPKSMRCFVSLKNEFSPSVEESSSLEPKIITVAGVQNRHYKNAVYKIVSENTRCYVSAEYATPLKTFKDVFDIKGDHSDHYNKHKKDIILQFYLTLEKVLEDRGLSQFCELIYYEDSYKNSFGETCYYDVGKIIQARLKDLKKRQGE